MHRPHILLITENSLRPYRRVNSAINNDVDHVRSRSPLAEWVWPFSMWKTEDRQPPLNTLQILQPSHFLQDTQRKPKQKLQRKRVNMKIVTLLALVAVVSAEFSCIKPVNPIPAGPPGVCCEKLDQNALLGFLYTGKTCMFFFERLWPRF